jgi:hypothetical protein
MSMFFCTSCDALADADDGCEEDASGLGLICATCADERMDAAEEVMDAIAKALEPEFRRVV